MRRSARGALPAQASDRDDGTKGLRNLASTARLNLILDQNAKMARAVAQYEAMHRPANLKIFPYVIYRASVGSRSPRDSHRRYDGMIIDKRDPWLRTHWPPWEFGCNCDLENCSAKKAATLGTVKPMSDPEDVKVDSESGFAFDPALGFREFDYSLIKDQSLREETREGVEKILTGGPEQSGNQYRQSAANNGGAADRAGGAGGAQSDGSDQSDKSDIAALKVKRQAQWNAAYEKRREKWRETMLKDGIPKDVVDEMLEMYSPQMAKLGKPPKMTMANGRGHYDPRRVEIIFDPNNGHTVDTCRHEFGHWVDYHSRLRPPRTGGNMNAKCAAFNAACDADWKKLKGMAKRQYPSGIRAFDFPITINPGHPSWNEGDYFEDVSQRLFNKPYRQLIVSERYVVAQYVDSVGSITLGKHGGGHTKGEYLTWNTEHFANAVAMWERGDPIFKLDFPETWSYINDVLDKGMWK